MSDVATDNIEDIDSFRARLRSWLAENMPRVTGASRMADADLTRNAGIPRPDREPAWPSGKNAELVGKTGSGPLDYPTVGPIG